MIDVCVCVCECVCVSVFVLERCQGGERVRLGENMCGLSGSVNVCVWCQSLTVIRVCIEGE